MWVALLTTSLWLLAENPVPPSPAPCPDPGDVATQLAQLGAHQGRQPEIAIMGDRMRVMLRGPDGALLGSREVEASVSCHERATVAAVLVATWMGVWPEAELQTPAAARPQETLTSSAPRPRATFGLSLLTALDGNGIAWGAGVETMLHLNGPLHLVVAVAATTEREQPLGPAHAGYRRPAVALGPVLVLGRGRLRWQLGATGQGGLLLLRGKGLATVHRTTNTELGAGAFLRVSFAARSFAPFIHVGAVTWFGHQHTTLDDAPYTAELPRWDAQLALGVSFSP